MKLLVGLGNPGKSYQKTRHNFGFLVVSSLAKKYGLVFKRSLFFKSRLARGNIAGKAALLALPQTFMNNSGIAVAGLMKRLRLKPHDLLVVCDDVNLRLGSLRIRASGSDGGHNGLSSIIAALGTREFPRLRLGVGPAGKPEGLASFVLTEFAQDNWPMVVVQTQKAVDCCQAWLKEGIVKAMDQFNKG
ncbi:MAG: aminoacyl-tRNA hydrolase [Candidatus Omnitrophota bacterium]